MIHANLQGRVGLVCPDISSPNFRARWLTTVILTRGQYLTIGPIALVAICYVVAAPGPSTLPASSRAETTPREISPDSNAQHLTELCRSTAQDLSGKFSDSWKFLVREPFVLGGDCDVRRIESTYRSTIAPTARALSIQYFDRPPLWPVTVLLCSTEESYRECHFRLNDRERGEYSGIYSRDEHRIVVNTSTGDGTLAHELTHALAHADFAQMPEWLDEGLASLHEECEFSADGLKLIGLNNWRRAVLCDALEREELRSLIDLTEERFATSDRAAVDYAYARYLCLFLQERELLAPLYRKCRSRFNGDPTGIRSLCELFGTQRVSEIDDQFVAWLAELKSATP